jgi:holo-[acyl-carrier protein] synthase
MAIGVDVVDVGRMERLLASNPATVDNLFTDRELRYCTKRSKCAEHLAARFAAKEAVLKAVGTGLGPCMRWTDVEIVNDVFGRPLVLLRGAVAAAAQRKGLGDIAVSITHTAGLAQAVAVSARQPASSD